MEIELKNRHFYKGPGVYIGRTNRKENLIGGPLQNEFTVERYGRQKAISLYKEKLEKEMQNPNSPMFIEIDRLAKKYIAGEKVILICWCYPEACHGDVVKLMIERQVKKILTERNKKSTRN